MIHLSDEELMVRCAHGNRCAMDVLVSRYHGKLLDFAFRHLQDRETAADIAQTTLVRAFQCAGSYRLKASFRTWLYTIAMNLVRDEFRRRRTRKESLSSESEAIEALLEGTAETPDSGSSPEDVILDKMAASELWQAVDRLGTNARSALILKFRDGLTYEEIAKVMGAPVGTVKSWVHYALRDLRELLTTGYNPNLEPGTCNFELEYHQFKSRDLN